MYYLHRLLYPFCIISILIASHYSHFIQQMSAAIAVFTGILISLAVTNPYPDMTKKLAGNILMWAVIGLGFGMNLVAIARVGVTGIGITLVSIISCCGIGWLLGKILGVKRDTSLLIFCGTAICGGSAIAALAPTIRAKADETSVALAIIFLLNAVSLCVFPPVGHYFGLTQAQFGLWAALAIHDTSSVVGACMQYGAKALEIGTTIKLARALWIVPVTFVVSQLYARYVFEQGVNSSGIKKPWFIVGFLLTAAIATWVPHIESYCQMLKHIAEQALIVALFCIGANLSRSALSTVGIMPMLQGCVLWLVMGCGTLLAISYGVFA